MALNFQQRSPLFVRRLVLVALIVVSVLMLTAYGREGESGPVHAVQSAVSGAIAPLRVVGAVAESGTDSVSTAFGNVTADESTLSGLRDYNAQLIQEHAQLEEYKSQAERLQKLLDIKDQYQIDGTGARVIGRSSEAWSQTVTIDKGSDDGVSSGLTVMGTSGVVGQVVSTSSHTSTVRLLSDPQSGAAAMVQSSRAEGILRGSLVGLLYLEDLDSDAQVNPGDVVVTSGMGGSYARGLVIGTVVKVDSQQGEANRRVVVAPNDEISALEEVLVVRGLTAPDDSDAAGSSSSTSGSSSSSSSGTSNSSSSSGSSNTTGTSNGGGTRNDA